MSKAENKETDIEEKKQKYSYSIHQYGLHNDDINPICTLIYKESEDRGFEFKTSNLHLIFRMSKKDYYNLIHTLFSEVNDEFQESDNFNPLIDDLEDFLIAKINGDIK